MVANIATIPEILLPVLRKDTAPVDTSMNFPIEVPAHRPGHMEEMAKRFENKALAYHKPEASTC